MIAFWVGEHQHTQTAGQAEATSKNSFSSFGVERQVSSVVPSITNTVLLKAPTSLFNQSCKFYQLVISLKNKNHWFLLFNPAEIAMQVAVSTLSPVSIQTLIPADLRPSKVY